MWKFYSLVFIWSIFIPNIYADNLVISDDFSEDLSLFSIEGKVFSPFQDAQQLVQLHSNADQRKWQSSTTVSINRGEFKGFLREDGTFTISAVPSGSYVLEVNNPDFYYEPIRVEINQKGKFRARKVNYVQPSQIIQVPYPLKMRALMRYKYFQTREQWKITDFLFNPMVLMMVLPLLIMLVLPKMISDPETKKEIENIQFPKMTHELPEISEVISSMFAGKQPEKEKKAATGKPNKKRN